MRKCLEQQIQRHVDLPYSILFLIDLIRSPNRVPQKHEIGEYPGRADKSEALFSMCLERANEYDKKVTERWKKETETILIFVGALPNPPLSELWC